MDNTQIYAVIENGIVSNLVCWDGKSEWHAPDGSIAKAIPSGVSVSIGYAFDGGTFAAPESA